MGLRYPVPQNVRQRVEEDELKRGDLYAQLPTGAVNRDLQDLPSGTQDLEQWISQPPPEPQQRRYIPRSESALSMSPEELDQLDLKLPQSPQGQPERPEGDWGDDSFTPATNEEKAVIPPQAQQEIANVSVRAQQTAAELPAAEEMSDPELDGLKNQLDKWKGKDVSGFKNMDLTPMLALVDAWTGSKFAQSYDKPMSNEDKDMMVSKLEMKLAGTQYQRAKEKASVKRQEDQYTRKLKHDMQRFQQQEAGRNQRLQKELANRLEVAGQKAINSKKDPYKTYVKEMRNTFPNMINSFSGGDFGAEYKGDEKKQLINYFERATEDVARTLAKNEDISPSQALARAYAATQSVTQAARTDYEGLTLKDIQQLVMDRARNPGGE